MTPIKKRQTADVAIVHKKLWTAIAAFPLVVGLNAGCEDEPRYEIDDCKEELDALNSFESKANCSNEYYQFTQEDAWACIPPESSLVQNIFGCPSRVNHFDLNFSRTQSERDSGNNTVCHYVYETSCIIDGRPLVDGEHHVVASIKDGAQWGGEDLNGEQLLFAEIQKLPDAVREEIAQEWLRDALFEHASVASFGRAALELMRHGAPPELLNATLNAALDEVKHAKLCFALASAYAGKSLAAGEITKMPPVRAQSLVELAVDVFLEGAIEESTAVLVAVRAASRCEIPAAKEALTKIIDDETNHAALAWATIAWTIQQGGAPVRQALLEAAHTADAHIVASQSCDPLTSGAGAWSQHGRLSHDEQRRARIDAWNRIIKPTLTRILEISTGRSGEVSVASLIGER